MSKKWGTNVFKTTSQDKDYVLQVHLWLYTVFQHDHMLEELMLSLYDRETIFCRENDALPDQYFLFTRWCLKNRRWDPTHRQHWNKTDAANESVRLAFFTKTTADWRMVGVLWYNTRLIAALWCVIFKRILLQRSRPVGPTNFYIPEMDRLCCVLYLSI